MNRLTLCILVLGVSVPMVAGAAMMKPSLNQNVNHSLGKAAQHPPSLQQFQQAPASLNAGLEQHAKMIQFKLDHLADSQVPEEKRSIVQADLEEELAWLQSMMVKAKTATTEEAQATLKEEIRAHLIGLQQARREQLSQHAQLPTTSPYDKAEEMSQHFETIIGQLQTKGLDTSSVEQALQEYTEAVAQGQAAYAQVTQDKTFARLTGLQDQLKEVREKGTVVSNLIRSLLVSNSDN